jgi:hypothetical protein
MKRRPRYSVSTIMAIVGIAALCSLLVRVGPGGLLWAIASFSVAVAAILHDHRRPS